MLKFFTGRNKQPSTANVPNNTTAEEGKKSMFAKLKQGLFRTRHNFQEKIVNLFLGKKQIDAEILAKLETILLNADLGVAATGQIIQALTKEVKRNELNSPEKLLEELQSMLENILSPCAKPLELDNKQTNTPYVILMVGINGAGKTTSIGKLAKKFIDSGKTVMLAAGDTFRAAAIEQLQTWGERNNVPVISQKHGSDSASVIFDAYASAKAKKIDVLIADTAGRLHTQGNLMQELHKISKVLKKHDTTAPHEIMLILDASIGQNGLTQASKFKDEIGVSGITITKLDGTAKGGIIFSIAKQFSLPIRYIGIGEGIDDLKEFDAKSFVEALFTEEEDVTIE
jgi:fused signal recognition particle receptor